MSGTSARPEPPHDPAPHDQGPRNPAPRAAARDASPVDDSRDSAFQVAIVGAGPRGLSVLERLCANERAAPAHRALTVHLIDPWPAGAGGVWRPEQAKLLLMNTVASQITVFTDDSVNLAGPVEPGPALDEWAKSLALLGEFDGYDDDTVAEARALDPDTYPTRAFYGHYLRACYERIVAGAPAHVRVRPHRSRAVSMADVHGVATGLQGLRLADGTRLDALDAIVLAQGHVPAQLTPRQARTASLARIHHCTYITPANPADVDLSVVAPGSRVLLRGLGLNFFDYMALLTEGRGGRYEERGGRLRYVPSGQEPRLYAFSRRGVPHQARGRNEKGPSGRWHPRLLTAETIVRLRRRAPSGLSLATNLWPLIAREVELAYYGTLLESQGRHAERDAFTERYAHADEAEAAALPGRFGIAPDDRWSWERLARPCAGRGFAHRRDFRAWLIGYLEQDVRRAEEGNVSGPLKAAVDVLRDLRNEVRLAVDHGGLGGASHRDELERWYSPLNAYLSIGPPVSRIREMRALLEAGVLEVLGPGTRVCFDASAPGFVASSGEVPGEPVHTRTLIEARLQEPDLRRTEDPLLQHLLHSGQAAPYRIGTGGDRYETGGLAVTGRPYRLIDSQGRSHPRRFAYGVPTEGVHWVTAAGVRPGVDSVTLGDADAIARALLELGPSRPVTHAHDEEAEPGLKGVIV